MKYWKGYMNWPIDKDWKCETCDRHSCLTWGLINGVCRCDTCHTPYSMRNNDEIVTTPVCRLKAEYKKPAKTGWEYTKTPISEWSDDDWDFAIKEAEMALPEEVS